MRMKEKRRLCIERNDIYEKWTELTDPNWSIYWFKKVEIEVNEVNYI